MDYATSATEAPSTASTMPSTTTEPLTTAPPATTASPLPTDTDLVPVPVPCAVPDPEALQRAVDEGHQPWRGDPVSVVHSCVAGAFDWAEPAIEQLDSNTYRATDPGSGDSATVAVTRPFPEATIWVIESVTR